MFEYVELPSVGWAFVVNRNHVGAELAAEIRLQSGIGGQFVSACLLVNTQAHHMLPCASYLGRVWSSYAYRLCMHMMYHRGVVCHPVTTDNTHAHTTLTSNRQHDGPATAQAT